ncbi:uncharacterized protein LOC141608847 [Silene latifolia]|uniref:uncharacterized protein LOC141608847 n=1 Tax=Silene latifolia TaxID=37657 RepID=UPI003D776333
MKVSELMVTGGGAWSEEKLSMYLLSFERERVRNIRLSEEDHDDMWYWAAERDGEYTVRSAYKLLLGFESDASEPSTWERSKWIWNNLWKVQVWPRIKLFFWQLCNDALATKAAFEGEKGEIDRVVRRIQRVLEEVEGDRVAQSKREGRLADEGQNEHGRGWTAPGEGWVKLNLDAGVKEGVSVGICGVCRDSAGKVLWSMAARRLEVWEAHVAEAVAVLEGLEEAVKAGHDAVIVESDCSQVIDGLNSRKTGRSVFALVLEDILRLCNSFVSVVFFSVSRKNNEVAHALAHALPVVSGRSVWMEKLPDVVSRYISLE